MLTWIREKFGTIVIGTIIAFIAFVFIFSGVVSPKATQGLHEGAVAGTVNGDYITLNEYNRNLNQRIEMFRNLFGGQGNIEDQLKNMRVRQGVFDDLVRRKILVQEATRHGLLPSDEEIRDRIREIDAFKQDGRFNVVKYRDVLAANGYTPESFERSLREDLVSEQWSRYFEKRVHVADTELKREFETTQNKRNVKYVLLTTETGRKGVQVSQEDIKKFLDDSARQNLARNHYEARKEAQYKGKTFDAVKESIAKEIIAGERLDEVKKVNEQLAAKIQPALTASKGSDAQVNAILKPYGVEVKSTGLITAQTPYLPGIGEAKELMADAFAAKSPIEGKAKTYRSANWVLVALVSESQRPDLAKLDSERDSLIRQIQQKKLRGIQEGWMKKLMERSKIVSNPDVVGANES